MLTYIYIPISILYIHHDNEKGWYGSLSPSRLPSIPSLFIYTDGKLLNYWYSLGTREMIGDIYSFDIRQINILYCYIAHTHPCQHSPAATLHGTRLPQTGDHLALMLSQVSSITPALSTPRGRRCPTPFPSTPYSTPTPRENQKLILINQSISFCWEVLMFDWSCLSPRAPVSLCLAMCPPESC